MKRDRTRNERAHRLYWRRRIDSKCAKCGKPSLWWACFGCRLSRV